jgi:DNA-binding MarR family transcriptional regulator
MANGHDIAMAIRAAYWAMHREADALLQPYGVTANQFVLLSIIAEDQGLTQQELVRRANSDANTVRAMLMLLEDRGLVHRRPHKIDGRARSVGLTSKGRKTYNALSTESRAFHRRLLAAVGPNSASVFIQQLRAVGNLAASEQYSYEEVKK